jgi:hypothetical protein
VVRYLSGEIDEKAFLKSVRFQKNWGFDWQNYRPLFVFAKEQGFLIRGLNCPPSKKKASLEQRDRFAAKVLVEGIQQAPDHVAIALLGDLHLASSHLPLQIDQYLSKKGAQRRVVVVHQNRERLYWKLAAQGLEHKVEVVELKKDTFCVLNTPPWVKLQSYLRWVDWPAEELRDRDSGVYEEEFFDLAKTIQAFIGSASPLSDAFEILWKTKTEEVSLRGQGALRELLVQNLGSYFIPRKKTVLLTSPSINGAATQAALYLHAAMSQREKEFEFPRQDFYSVVWFEALGFFGSKVINPHRRCYGPLDFFEARSQHPLASLVTQHLEAEMAAYSGVVFRGIALPSRTVLPIRALWYYRVARCLGQILGNALYAATVANLVSVEELQALFQDPFTHGKKAQQKYLHWVGRLDAHSLRQAIRRS